MDLKKSQNFLKSLVEYTMNYTPTSFLSDLLADLRSALFKDSNPLKSLESLKRGWKIAEDLLTKS